MRSYEMDYAGWAEDTARAICEGRWHDIDRATLADEVLDLKKRVEHQVESRMRVLLIHLLKARYQPGKHGRSWDLTIAEQRYRANLLLRENPSLKPELPRLIQDAYGAARYAAARQTAIALDVFPEQNPFTDAEIWSHALDYRE